MKNTPSKRNLLKRMLAVLPVAAAILAVVYLVAHKPGPPRRPEKEAVRTLRVVSVPAVDLVPRATGYGVAAPGTIWEAVAEVPGTVAEVHPRLASGELIDAGSVLVRLDPSEYRLSVSRLEAGVQETLARLDQLAAEAENTVRLIEIERRSLALARQTLARKQEALGRNAISGDEVDREERNVLQQTQSVQQHENALALVPSRRKALEAALAVQRASLDQARIDLDKTTISAPFDCRLGEVRLESGQYLRSGQLLFQAHGTAVTEVEARFRMEALRHLLSADRRREMAPGLGSGAFRRIFADVQAVVRLQSGQWSTFWPARIDRFRESVDARTREMRVVVVVENPYAQAVPGERPPLTAGMFCRVELFAPTRPTSLVVPRSAIHGDTLFVVDAQKRLQPVKVAIDTVRDDLAVIRSGLVAGQLVVTSDPAPAIIGMRVEPVADERLRDHLIASSRKGPATE